MAFLNLGGRIIRAAVLGIGVALAGVSVPLPDGTGGAAFAQGARSFGSIQVSGNQRIEAATIRSFAGIPVNVPVGGDEINAAVRRLFETGLFESVDIVPQGNSLVIQVTENPTINRIAFEGNKRIDDEQLQSVIRLRPRQPFNRAAAEADVAAIVAAYAAGGRFTAQVRPVIIQRPDNRVDLVFEVFEGDTTEIQKISFVGNEKYSDRRLRRVIETSQAGLLSFIVQSDTYDRDRLEFDKQLLRDFYLERGHADFQVRSATAEMSRERDGFFVAFNLYEGPVYRFGRIGVAADNPRLDPTEFEKLIDVRSGDVYSSKDVEQIIERMAFLAGQKGFAFVDVRPRVQKNANNRTIDIVFELFEGPRVFIERIDIRGNTNTLDRVVRRQFEFAEGDAFNSRALRRGEDRIRGLGYFGNVAVRVEEGSAPNRAVIDVEVEEAPTGSLSFGLSYDTQEGIAGTIELTERNFLGRGQTVSVLLGKSTDLTTASFSFTEPALLDRDLLGGFDIYYRDFSRTESSYQTKNIGFEPRIGFPVSENGRLTLRYRGSSDEISEIGDNVSPIIAADVGELSTSAIGFTYAYDRRNSVVDPTAGFIFVLNQDLSGVGGDTSYSKTVARARVFRSFFDEELIVSGELEGGYLTTFKGNTRVIDRFFLGGDTFRGFARSGVGPRDVCSACSATGGDIDDSLGGNSYAMARFQGSFPIGLPPEWGIYGGVFAEAGSLWSLDNVVPGASGEIDDKFRLRSAAGVSLFWETPIGPLRFDWAYPIQFEDTDVLEKFRFSIGTRF
ncbi:outer membrane protein assembly factor BamA [Oceanomicrobium pacificus]|uniref:Outer membrane protein assembly factor BamA n=1 Tax=Oceanomicrobium pacificus TaxID=2692916 RepID=A0A6B0TMM8_9RHOB|nr:outer membrane protein assembly factor BamA [Oceanomicrobium pacificus]MXU65830.1 outer membrane protein assembly factor BamA [Oceanomicrobium pacificus]